MKKTEVSYNKVYVVGSLLLMLCAFTFIGIDTTLNGLINNELRFVSGPGRELQSLQSVDFSRAEDIQKGPRFYWIYGTATILPLPSDRNALCAPNNGTCDWITYATSIALTGLAGFILAIIFLITGVLFCLFRLCGCCGGCKASHGLCCGTPFNMEEGDGYTKAQWIIPTILLILCFILILACFIIGLVGNGQVTSSLTGFKDATIGEANDFINTLISVNSSLVALQLRSQAIAATDNNFNNTLPDLSQVVSQLSSAIQAGTTFTNEANNYANMVFQYDGYREKVMQGVYWTTLILTAAGVAGAIFGLGALSIILGIVGWLTMFINWVLFGIHYPIANLIADLCIAVRDLLDTTTNLDGIPSQISATIQQFESCSNTSQLAAFEQIAQNGITFAFNVSCTTAKQLCNTSFSSFNNGSSGCGSINNNSICGDVAPYNNCTVGGCDGECDQTTFQTFIDGIQIPSVIYGCFQNVSNFEIPITNASQCTDRCPLPPYANYPRNMTACANPSDIIAPCAVRYVNVYACANDDPSCPVNASTATYINNTVQALDLLQDYIALFNQITSQILNCSLIQNIFDQVGYSLCNSDNSFLSATFLISVSTGIIAAALLPATIIGIIGFKRFDRGNHKYAAHDPSFHSFQ